MSDTIGSSRLQEGKKVPAFAVERAYVGIWHMHILITSGAWGSHLTTRIKSVPSGWLLVTTWKIILVIILLRTLGGHRHYYFVVSTWVSETESSRRKELHLCYCYIIVTQSTVNSQPQVNQPWSRHRDIYCSDSSVQFSSVQFSSVQFSSVYRVSLFAEKGG